MSQTAAMLCAPSDYGRQRGTVLERAGRPVRAREIHTTVEPALVADDRDAQATISRLKEPRALRVSDDDAGIETRLESGTLGEARRSADRVGREPLSDVWSPGEERCTRSVSVAEAVSAERIGVMADHHPAAVLDPVQARRTDVNRRRLPVDHDGSALEADDETERGRGEVP